MYILDSVTVNKSPPLVSCNLFNLKIPSLPYRRKGRTSPRSTSQPVRDGICLFLASQKTC